jgi:excisionase family DNA binding protein
MKRWYTPKEAAEVLGYEDIEQIYDLIHQGILPGFQPKPRGRIRLSVLAVEDFIRKHTINPHLIPKAQ